MKILHVHKRRVVAWGAAVVLGACAVAFRAFAGHLELAAFVAPCRRSPAGLAPTRIFR